MDIKEGDQVFWFKQRPRREKVTVQVLSIKQSRAKVTYVDPAGNAQVNYVALENLEHPREKSGIHLSSARDASFAGPTFHFS